MYESLYDIWIHIRKYSYVHMYYLVPCVIACMFRVQTYQRPVTRSLIVIRIPIGGGAYVESLETRGEIYHKVLGIINWPLPGNVEVQRTRRCGATV